MREYRKIRFTNIIFVEEMTDFVCRIRDLLDKIGEVLVKGLRS